MSDKLSTAAIEKCIAYTGISAKVYDNATLARAELSALTEENERLRGEVAAAEQEAIRFVCEQISTDNLDSTDEYEVKKVFKRYEYFKKLNKYRSDK